jgi:DNA invertase Pin-like site-specific DNA recombinase
MSKDNGKQVDLTGQGAAYVRVSDDQQDTLRQYEAIHSFEKRHSVTIPKLHWFKDEGWARDTADRRPDFQRLMKLAETGQVRWIVVSERDRFGTTDADEFVHYRYRLRKCGCRLYDAAGTDWTRKDIATVITAVVEGEKSEQEQHSISKRTLGGKVVKARLGEWQGGPVRLGFDVVCYRRETGDELWRVVLDSFQMRQKVYPDGRSERFDGEGNFPKFQPLAEVLRVAPSRDELKIKAAVSVFKRFATESISFTALAHHLNQLGFRNGYGGHFQGQHVESMLEDPIYLGYYTYNRRHSGKFHRWTKGQPVLELNYQEEQSKNGKADWVQSHRLFPPLVEQWTWDAVQRKLGDQSKRTRAPRSPSQYLAGLVICGNCGKPMVAGPVRKTLSKPRKDGHTGERHEYFCGTYAKCCKEKRREESCCLRNGVFQDVLEEYVSRYLEETGRRLELLTQRPEGDCLTDRLEGQQDEAWQGFCDGLNRLTAYLAQHHPDEFAAVVQEDEARRADEEQNLLVNADSPGLPPSSLTRLGGKGLDEAIQKAMKSEPPSLPADPYIRECVSVYRSVFDPSRLTAEIEQLEEKHTVLMRRWADLPTPRAKEKAKKELAALEARIAELEQQRQNVAEIVEQHYRQMNDLQTAIGEAKRLMRSEAGERALRHRAEAVRAVIQRIECNFTATGETGGGWGKKNARLTSVTIYPVVGDSAAFPVDSAESKGTLTYSSAHSRMKRTRLGRMR